MVPIDFDNLLDRELQRLPAPAAPPALLPRIMEAVEARARAPWYRRAWVTWPLGWRAASAAAVAAFLASIVLTWPGGERALDGLWSFVALHVSDRAAGILQAGRQAAILMRVSWDVLLQPVATYVAALMLVVSLGLTAFWTALNRLALGGASHQ